MKTQRQILASGALALSFIFHPGSLVKAATTIDAANRYAYGANLGWTDWRGDNISGAVIGEYVCSGYIYSADAGWIGLGNGAPTNGIAYQSLSADDFGVNHDGLGNLRGYAWGANIGWVSFESQGAPKVDLKTGKFSGSIYSANCGWINLSNTQAYVKTDTVAPGAIGANGLPIAWQLLNFGNTNVDPDADPDGDGMSNLREYLDGTDPNNGSDKLVITGISVNAGGTSVNLTWDTVLTRCYYIQEKLSLTSPDWFDSGLGLISPGDGTTTGIIADTNAPIRFYRIQAARPLGP